jgi:hypothetical protein
MDRLTDLTRQLEEAECEFEEARECEDLETQLTLAFRVQDLQTEIENEIYKAAGINPNTRTM